jgi:hypothetical protein
LFKLKPLSVEAKVVKLVMDIFFFNVTGLVVQTQLGGIGSLQSSESLARINGLPNLNNGGIIKRTNEVHPLWFTVGFNKRPDFLPTNWLG